MSQSVPAHLADPVRGRRGSWRGVWTHISIVSGLTAFVKCAGAIKAVVIARYFGSGADLDAYLLAFLIPSSIADVLCGAIVPALIPRLIELRHRGKDAAASEITARAFQRSLAFVGCVALLVALLAVYGILFRWGGSRGTLAFWLLLILVPMIPLSAASNVGRAMLNAGGRFAASTSAAAMTPLAIILSLFVAGRSTRWLAAGTTFGAAGEALILAFALRGSRIPWMSRLAAPCGDLRLPIHQYAALALNNLVLYGSLFLDQSMAALLGAGAVSILNYGTRLTAVLIALGPNALGITLLPRFARMMTEEGHSRTRKKISAFVSIAMCASAAVIAVLVGFSQPIVRLAFERGAFAADATIAVTSVQQLSLLQLPFVVGSVLLTRLITSANRNALLIPISALNLLLNAVLNVVLMRRFSVAGIALATSAAQAVTFVLLLISALRILRRPEAERC